MHRPLDAVVILAHFSLTKAQIDEANNLLKGLSDWDSWLEQIELHGLSGFAVKHIEQYGLPVPRKSLLALKALVVRHRLAAEARYQALLEVDRIFNQFEVPYIALKGMALLPMIYGQAEYRPMRDVDILIPTEKESAATDALRAIGFDVPAVCDNKYMSGIHELPAATKTYHGFNVTIELHRDAVTRDARGSLRFPKNNQNQQTVAWKELSFMAFDDLMMIDQVARHLVALHPNGVLKLCNVMDVVGLAEYIRQKGKWSQLEREYPYILNVLRCLHLYTPLPNGLAKQIIDLPTVSIDGAGQSMLSFRASLLKAHQSKWLALRSMLSPSDWWLHLYYNVAPSQSLFWVKVLRHPLRLTIWFAQRFKASLSALV